MAAGCDAVPAATHRSRPSGAPTAMEAVDNEHRRGRTRRPVTGAHRWASALRTARRLHHVRQLEARTGDDRRRWPDQRGRAYGLSDTDGYHRVVWALSGGSLRAECPCKGFHHRDWCAHLASLWWRWVRGQIEVTHIETGRRYRTPSSWLSFDRNDRSHVFEGLTPAELDAYLTCEWGTVGVREYARETDRSPGTVGNQLRWAREKVGGQR